MKENIKNTFYGFLVFSPLPAFIGMIVAFDNKNWIIGGILTAYLIILISWAIGYAMSHDPPRNLYY